MDFDLVGFLGRRGVTFFMRVERISSVLRSIDLINRTVSRQRNIG